MLKHVLQDKIRTTLHAISKLGCKPAIDSRKSVEKCIMWSTNMICKRHWGPSLLCHQSISQSNAYQLKKNIEEYTQSEPEILNIILNIPQFWLYVVGIFHGRKLGTV